MDKQYYALLKVPIIGSERSARVALPLPPPTVVQYPGISSPPSQLTGSSWMLKHSVKMSEKVLHSQVGNGDHSFMQEPVEKPLKVYLFLYCIHHINMVWNLGWEEITILGTASHLTFIHTWTYLI